MSLLSPGTGQDSSLRSNVIATREKSERVLRSRKSHRSTSSSSALRNSGRIIASGSGTNAINAIKDIRATPKSPSYKYEGKRLTEEKRTSIERIDRMSVSELKRLIIKNGGKFRDCSTIAKLRSRAKKVYTKHISSKKKSESLRSGIRNLEITRSLESNDSARKVVLKSDDSISSSAITSIDDCSAVNTQVLTSENGLVGLKNIGNTCFMNSCIQCLSNIPLLRKYLCTCDLKSAVNKSSSTKGRIALAFAKLLKRMWSASSFSSETPSELKSVVGKMASRFLTYHQQDAQEFMVYLLDGLHEDLNRIDVKPEYKDIEDQKEGESDRDLASRWWRHYELRNDSPIKDMFAGQLRSELTCMTCQRKSVRFDPFWDLSLPVPSEKTKGSIVGSLRRLERDGKCDIYDCLRAFVKVEQLNSSEAPYCPNCKTSCAAQKHFTIFRLPKVLVLHMKRFSDIPGGRIRRRRKLNVNISCPMHNLDMSPFCAPTSPCVESGAESDRNEAASRLETNAETRYNLVAVSNHIGSIHGGHYTADCSNSTKMKWYHFDDSRVSEISDEGAKLNERTAYILFYARSDCS